MLRLCKIPARISSSRGLRIRSPTLVQGQTYLPKRIISQRQVQIPLFMPRLASQCRFFSQKSEQNEFNVDIKVLPEDEKFTATILSSALGTLSTSQVDQTLEMINHWLNTNSGYGLDSANRLLQRLTYEHAAAPYALQNYYPMLMDWHVKLLESFLQFKQYPSALERAEPILLRLMDRKVAGSTIDLATPHQFVRLISSWLALPSQYSSEGSSHAAQLLLWWTEDIKSATSVHGALQPTFHMALDQCVACQNKKLAQALLGRMNELHSLEEWNGIEPHESLWKAVNDLPALGKSEVPGTVAPLGSSTVMSAEGTVLRRLLLSYLETAQASDADQVKEFALQYQPWAISSESKEEFHIAITDYYMRFRNVTEATQWVQKIDPLTCSNRAWLEKSFESLLHLWSKEMSSEAPWRAHEILQRMEAIGAANPESYSLVTEMWLASSEPSARRKSRQLLSRIVQFFAPGNPIPKLDLRTLYIMLKFPNEFNGVVSLLDQTAVFLKNCNRLPKRLLLETVEMLLGALAQRGMGDLANRVVKHPLVESVLTETTCELALTASANSKLPRCTEFLFSHLSQRRSHMLSFRCYDITVSALVNDLQPGSIETVQGLIRGVAAQMSSGNLDVTPDDFADMIVRASVELRTKKRPNDADKLLRLVERLFLPSDQLPRWNEGFFSILSYNNVLEAWLESGRYDMAEETMDRVLHLYRSGLSTLMPTTFTFSRFLKHYSEQKDGEKKVIEWFGKMVRLYKETNNDGCKPDIVSFDITMRSIAESDASPARALEVFENLLDIGLKPRSFTFNQLMKSFLKSENPYREVMKLVEKMNDFGLVPDEYTTLIVLDACAMATPRDRESALGTATQFFGRLRQRGRPLAGHYMSYFDVLHNQIPPKDPRLETLVLSSFHLCCSDGYREIAWRHLRPLVTKELCFKLNKIKNKVQPMTEPNHPEESSSEERVDAVATEATPPNSPSDARDVTALLDFIRRLGLVEKSTILNKGNVREISDLVEITLEALVRRGKGRKAEELLLLTMHHLNITSTMCEHALQAHYQSSRGAAPGLFQALNRLKAPLSYKCYRIAILALVHSRQEDRFESVAGLFQDIVNRVIAGQWKDDQREFERLIFDVTLAYEMYGHVQQAHDLILMLDEMVYEGAYDKTSVESWFGHQVYENLFNGWLKVNDFERAKAVLDLINRRCQNEKVRLKANSGYMSSAITYYSRQENPDLAAKHLDQLIELYEKTGNMACKPAIYDFRRVIRCLGNHSNKSYLQRALRYLDKQIELGYIPQVATITTVMELLVKNEEHAFRSVMDIHRRMKDLEIFGDVATSSLILESCLTAQPQDKDVALETAMREISQNHEKGRTTIIMFSTFFRVLDVIGKDDPRYDEIFSKAFKMCWSVANFRSFAEAELKGKISMAMWEELTKESENDPSYPATSVIAVNA